MISEYKIPEPLEKGMLRARNNVFVFKDGTIRFDATDAPITHFKPSEINVGIKKLKDLGYVKDYLGNKLEDEEQIIAPQCLHFGRVGANHHALGHEGITRFREVLSTFDLHQAELAAFIALGLGAVAADALAATVDHLVRLRSRRWGQVRMRAKMRDVDVCLLRRI